VIRVAVARVSAPGVRAEVLAPVSLSIDVVAMIAITFVEGAPALAVV